MARERLITAPFAFAALANFLDSLVLHSFVHLPGFLQELGADELEVGLVMAAMAGSAIAARPAIGRLIDLRGRRPVAVGGALIHVAAVALYLTVESLGPWIYGVRILHGIGQACLFSVLFTVAADVVPAERRTEGLALFGVSGMLCLSLGALLGEVVLARGGYGDLFRVQAAISAACLLAVLPITESRPSPGGPRPRGVLAALAEPRLRPLWAVGVGFSLALSAFFVFLKTFVLTTGIGSVGLFFTPYAVTAIVLRVFFGWIPDRIGAERTLGPSVLFVAGGLGVLAASGTGVEVAVAGALCGIGHGYAFPILSSLVVSRAAPSDRGAAVTLFTALFDAGLLAGGPLLGAIIEWTSHRSMFAAAAALAVAAVVLFALWDPRVARDATSTTGNETAK